MLSRLSLSALALCCAVSTAAAQCFDPNLGNPLSSGDDVVLPNNALGFSFPWPDGTMSTAIDIDSNGRIFQPGASTSISYPDVYEFTSGATSIAPFWTDIDPSDPLSDDVYFFTDNATTAVITWRNVVLFGDTQPVTFQAVMRSDGSVRFAYDERMTSSGYYSLPVTGVSPGGGVSYSYAGSIDVSSTLTTPFDSGADPLVFENFYYNYGGTFDLDGFAFDFTQNGNGGYLVIGIDCGFARVETVGRGCFPLGTGLDWIGDGTGGYIVTPSGSVFDNRPGASLGLSDDSTSTQQLGFSFTMPGGQSVTSIDVDSNGRVLAGGAGLSQFTATVANLLAAPSGVLCGFWTDLNPGAAGDVTYFTDGSGFATITWEDVPQYAQTNAVTFQIQLEAPADWTLLLTDVGSFNNDDLLIGCSAGSGAPDPGESDLSALPILTNGVATQYELFTMAEVFDLAGAAPLELVAQSTPRLGASFDLTLTEIPSTALQAAVLLGTSNPNLDLSLVFNGLNCFLLSNNRLSTLNLGVAGWTPGMASGSVSISLATASPVLIGLPLAAQGVIVDTNLPWAGTLPIATSNAVIGIVGN